MMVSSVDDTGLATFTVVLVAPRAAIARIDGARWKPPRQRLLSNTPAMRPIGSFDPKLTTLPQRARRASVIFARKICLAVAPALRKQIQLATSSHSAPLAVAAAVAVAQLCAGGEQGPEQAV
jgi:23S rRNA C2498 (ribose-2'-O)-methylase RlmM